MKRIRTASSSVSDARLKALLRGLRGDVAAPPGFTARVLASLRAEGLLAPESECASARVGAEAWWVRLGSRLFSVPRLGLAAAAALVLAAAVGVYWGPLSFRAVAPSPVPSALGPAHTSSPFHPSALAAVSRRPAPAALVLARPRPPSSTPRLERRPVSVEAVLASSSAPAPVQGKAALGSVVAAASVPALGQGLAAPQAGAVRANLGMVAAPSSLAGGAPVPAGSVASGFNAGSSPPPTGGGPTFAGSMAPLAKSDPTPGPTPPPLGVNSQVRNNVILASKGQSAQILFKVAQAGNVLVAIYDRLGQRVAVLQDGPLGPGQYDNYYWDGQSGFGGMAASGIYVVVIRTPTYTDLHKIMLVK